MNKFLPVLLLLLWGCSQDFKMKSQADSGFNITSDFGDFKNLMTENDTITLWVNHSACTMEGLEKVFITKSKDSLRVVSYFSKDFLEANTPMEKVYDRTIAIGDTAWDFEGFLKSNIQRLDFSENKSLRLEISDGENKLKFFAEGLGDQGVFMKDYFETMLALFPENTGLIYGIKQPIDIQDSKYFSNDLNTELSSKVNLIENYYRAHAQIWEGPSEEIDARLDSLQALYCTTALQEQSQRFLERGGFDYLTLERGISVQSLEDLTVTPDHNVPNRFNVAYTAYYDDGAGNEIPQKVSFYVTVTEVNDSMKISSVSE